MTTNDSIRVVRILVSSPGDVSEERDRARQVVDSLRRRYARKFSLKPLFWEELPLQVDTAFQQGIDLVLSADQGVDIAVFILWSRLGSAIGPMVTREDGSEYRSGTERELSMMLQAREQGGGTKPAILAYTRRDEASFEERLRGKPTTEKIELIAQKKLVEAFIEETFTDKEGGHNIRAFHSYDRPVTFSQRLRVHLVELLDQVAGEATETAWDIDKQGAPYLGLAAFQREHADVFFGREEEILEARFVLREQAKQGCAFLLLTGASGSGKSSLARSGILPDLVQNEVDDHVTSWRSMVIMPSELSQHPIRTLISRLASPELLPDLRNDRTDLATLERGLLENPQLTYELVVKPAIERLSQPSQGQVRLLIVIDQLEEIFASHVMTASDRESFLKIVEVLATNGLVWVLATARSDFYHQIQNEPTLLKLLEGRGPMPVAPPGPDALQRLIEEPAHLAGLRFEERDGISLATRVLRDATRHPEMLPLVEFVLRELYEHRTDGELTFSTYDSLGGIVGAIGNQAEKAIQSLSENAKAALTEVLPLLVTIEIAGEQAPVRRRATLSDLRSSPAKQELTDRLISSRFLTTDQLDESPVVSLAHESLLRSWKRIESWVNFNRENLSIRARVNSAALNWNLQGRRSDLLLVSGKPLEEAMELAHAGMQLDDLAVEFIEQSRIRVRRNERLRQLAVASLAAMTVASIVFGVMAWISRDAANSSQQLAEKRAADALASKDELKRQLYDNSIAIAERELSQNHDVVKASQLLNSDSCPEEMRGWEWRYLMRLRDGGRSPLADHTAGLWGAEFSPDGKLIATCSIDGTIKIWDAATGTIAHTIEPRLFGIDQTLLTSLGIPRMPIMCLSFSPDGTQLAAGSFKPIVGFDLKPDRNSPGLVQIWDVQSKELVSKFEDQRGVSLSLTYSPDGKRIASSSISPDNSFVVWEPHTGKIVKRVHGHASQVHRLRYSPDGKILAAGETDGVIKLWDATTFEEIMSIDAHTAPVVGLSFSPTDRHRFASAGEDGFVRIWNMQSGKLLTELQGHSGSALDVRYSPDGTRLASAGFDKTVRVWDAESGKEKITLRGHEELVWNVSFSPDGHRLVSSSFDNTARIWDATPREFDQSEGELVLSGHAERVNSIAALDDSDFVVTGGWDRSVRTWDKSTGIANHVLQGHVGTVWCVDLSPDGERIASASWDHTAKIWDLKSGRELVSFAEHTAPVHSVAFSPDGKKVATGGFDGQMKIWDSTDGSLIANGDGFIFPVMSVVFTPSGKSVVSGGADRKVKIWNSSTGEEVLTLSGHQASVHGLAISADGSRLASASWDKTVRVWDLSPGKNADERELVVFTGHQDRVNGVAFSPNGRFVASASEDKTVRLWDASTGEEVVPPHRHRAVVWSVKFLSDGQRLASASWEDPNWIHVWNVDWTQETESPAAIPTENERKAVP